MRENPSDEALVVRGGVLSVEALRSRASKDFARLFRYGISVFADDSLSLKDLVEAGPVPHGRIQKSTVRRIKEAGFHMEATGRWPHCTVWLGEQLTDAILKRFIDAFDPPEETP